MPLSQALIVSAVVGFGLSVAAGPASAANSQPHKAFPSNISLAKGGKNTMHRKSDTDSSAELSGRSPEGNDVLAGPGRFAAMLEPSHGADTRH